MYYPFNLTNQIKSIFLFKVSNVYLKEKKISKQVFTRLYSITNNNKLYIWFKNTKPFQLDKVLTFLAWQCVDIFSLTICWPF